MGTVRSAMLAGLMLATAASMVNAADDPAPQPAAASAPTAAPEARIPFAKTNLWNWQVVDDKTVLIQDQSRRWYKATLFGICTNLAFANRIGFDSNPGGTFDKFSSLLVRGQRCPLSSLVKTDPPAKKAKVPKPPPASTAQ
jgi:Family of unknown function (DUF6491)